VRNDQHPSLCGNDISKEWLERGESLDSTEVLSNQYLHVATYLD
jgi:hypothetical protein